MGSGIDNAAADNSMYDMNDVWADAIYDRHKAPVKKPHRGAGNGIYDSWRTDWSGIMTEVITYMAGALVEGSPGHQMNSTPMTSNTSAINSIISSPKLFTLINDLLY